MTTIDNVTTWRELAGQLTAAQITDMEIFERDTSAYKPSPGALVLIATSMVETNEGQIRFAHIPVPADAMDVPSPWEELDTDLWQRVYCAWRHPDVPDAVQVLGYQRSDGTVHRTIFANVDLEDIDAGTARAIAAALIQAADELDPAQRVHSGRVATMSTLTQIAASYGVEPYQLAALVDMDKADPDAALTDEQVAFIVDVADNTDALGVYIDPQ